MLLLQLGLGLLPSCPQMDNDNTFEVTIKRNSLGLGFRSDDVIFVSISCSFADPDKKEKKSENFYYVFLKAGCSFRRT
jgi:hypothetical protein